MRRYGSSAWHLAAHVVAVAVCGYALVRILEAGRTDQILLWMAVAILLHDALLWPVETLLDRAAQARARRRGSVNYVRVPAGLSLLLLLAFLPVISQKGEGAYSRVSGRQFEGDVGRWLLATAVLFALSGSVYLARSAGARRSARSR